MRQNLVHQQGCDIRHTSRSATGAEAAPLTTECHEFLIVAGFTPYPEKTMLKPSALPVLIKLSYDVRW